MGMGRRVLYGYGQAWLGLALPGASDLRVEVGSGTYKRSGRGVMSQMWLLGMGLMRCPLRLKRCLLGMFIGQLVVDRMELPGPRIQSSSTSIQVRCLCLGGSRNSSFYSNTRIVVLFLQLTSGPGIQQPACYIGSVTTWTTSRESYQIGIEPIGARSQLSSLARQLLPPLSLTLLQLSLLLLTPILIHYSQPHPYYYYYVDQVCPGLLSLFISHLVLSLSLLLLLQLGLLLIIIPIQVQFLLPLVNFLVWCSIPVGIV